MRDTAAVKKAAKKQLQDNWSKAFASMAIVLLSMLAAFIAEELVNNLLQAYGVTEKFDVTKLDVTKDVYVAAQYIKDFVTTRSFMMTAVITVFFILIRFLVLTPLHQGQTTWFYYVAEGSNDQLSKLFYYYGSNDMYVSALSFRFSLFFKKIGYAIISFIAPAAALGMTVNQYLKFLAGGNEADKKNAILYLFITIALILLGTLLFFLLSLKLFLARYIFARSAVNLKHAETGKCFAQSQKLMIKNRRRVIILFVSMLPAFLSCILIVPLLYVYPYFFCCCAELANEIIESGNNK